MLTIYRASAGSGKTFTLAREYIKLLLGKYDESARRFRLCKESNRHRSILGVTFTNKATEEMKRRIIHELAVLAKMETGWENVKSPYEESLTEEFGCSSKELSEAAARALRSLLNDFNKFQISTIDSFFQGVLRAFAREAELSGNYEVSLDRKAHIALAVDHMLQSLRTDDDPRANRKLVKWLLDLIDERMDNGKSYNPFNRSTSLFSDVVTFIDKITDETFTDNKTAIIGYLNDPADLLGQFVRALPECRNTLLNTIAATAADLLDAIKARGFEAKELLSSHAFNLVEKWNKNEWPSSIAKGTTSVKMAQDPASTIRNKRVKGCQQPVYDLDSDPALSALMSRFGRLTANVEDSVTLCKRLAANTYTLGLLMRTNEFLSNDLNEANTLLLSDTNSILSDIISEGDAPFVYERIGTYLDHFLIDEFQDTSRLQWGVLSPLLEEGLGRGNDSLIIGDEKQCIYRFRNSDPGLLQHQVSTDMEAFLDHTPPKRDFNWRSSPVIVNFNNDLFARLAERLGHDGVYANVAQLIPEKNAGLEGYVRVCFTGSDDNANLTMMMDDITRQLNAGYRPGDIAVLVRTSTEGSKAIDFILNAKDTNPEWPKLRVVSDDSMRIDSSPTVRLVISIVRMLATGFRTSAIPEGDARSRILQKRISAERFRKSFEQGMTEGRSRSDSMLLAISRQTSRIVVSGEDCDSEEEEIERMRLAILDEAGCADLTTVFESAIRRVRTPSMSDSENIYLTALQDLVAEFTRRQNNDLRQFLKWWDTAGHKSKVALPPDSNAVRVMTVHKSKGLEFPCVHIPFGSLSMFDSARQQTTWFDLSQISTDIDIDPSIVPTLFPLKPAPWMQSTSLAAQFNRIRLDSILDELNTAYVAFTRAGSELCVALTEITPPKDSSSLYENLGPHIACLLGLSESEPAIEFGAPTSPRDKESKPLKTLDPSGSCPMPPYEPRLRSDLWSRSIVSNESDS